MAVRMWMRFALSQEEGRLPVDYDPELLHDVLYEGVDSWYFFWTMLWNAPTPGRIAVARPPAFRGDDVLVEWVSNDPDPDVAHQEALFYFVDPALNMLDLRNGASHGGEILGDLAPFGLVYDEYVSFSFA
jgi:hypothetical protein